VMRILFRGMIVVTRMRIVLKVFWGNVTGNKVKATFSSGNWFLFNTANNSYNGFLLDYSHDNNYIYGNVAGNNQGAGLSIAHGQNNNIKGKINFSLSVKI
jgi:parallel beta-helix repeat protein